MIEQKVEELPEAVREWLDGVISRGEEVHVSVESGVVLKIAPKSRTNGTIVPSDFLARMETALERAEAGKPTPDWLDGDLPRLRDIVGFLHRVSKEEATANEFERESWAEAIRWFLDEEAGQSTPERICEEELEELIGPALDDIEHGRVSSLEDLCGQMEEKYGFRSRLHR